MKKEVETLGSKASTFSADVNKRDNGYAVIKHTEQELGGFDVMVNNAGIASFPPKPVIA
ncbi:SDR family NAD(P)-dependent oxidoreductase [Ochrobactrum sp. Marseille-Q0166]|uniref:SDR family NAD(P)-dependent oxidoreductase n=1 Tax=Ochrobactrum sp. Marseille-Q0166 TaxID=2761105 RepID=UPI0032B58BFD